MRIETGKTVAAALVAAGALAWGAGPVEAGTYQVYSKHSASNNENSAFTFIRSSGSATESAEDPRLGLGIKLTVPSMARYDSGTWSFLAPSGTSAIAVEADLLCHAPAGVKWFAGPTDGSGFFHGGCSPGTSGAMFGGFSESFNFAGLTLGCAYDGYCDDTTAYAYMRNIAVTVYDGLVPAVSAVNLPQYVKGTLQQTISATDNAGLTSLSMNVDGVSRQPETASRPWGEPSGTPALSKQEEIDSTKLGDGPHVFQAVATDIAGNVGAGQAKTATVDNTPPGNPQAVAITPAGESSGPFSARVTRSAVGEASPITAIYYKTKVAPTSPSDGAKILVPANAPDVKVQLPAPAGASGQTPVFIWQEDAAGNVTPLATARQAVAHLNVKVQGNSPPPARAEQGTGDVTVEAHFAEGAAAAAAANADGSAGDDAQTVSFGRAPTVVAQVLEAGRPAAAVPLAAAIDGESGKESVVSLGKTAADGRLITRKLVGRGNATITILTDDSRRQRSNPLTLRTRARVGLHLAPRRIANGQVVRLGGQVSLPPRSRAPRGLVTEIWVVSTRTHKPLKKVAVAPVSRSGRFFWSHRFEKLEPRPGIARYVLSFQARIARQKGFPFEPGRSRLKHLTVTPRRL